MGSVFNILFLPKHRRNNTNFSQVCMDDKLTFLTVTNIRSKTEEITFKKKVFLMEIQIYRGVKTNVTYTTPCKLK